MSVREAESSQRLDTALRSLRAAKHRFESTQKPAGRFILFFEAVLKTSYRIAKLRSGEDPGKRATDFLLGLSEERILQLALMADAGDEAMQLTRGANNEDADVAIFPDEIANFLHRTATLFIHGQVFTTKGHTQHILHLLEHKNFSFALDGGRTVGGSCPNASGTNA